MFKILQVSYKKDEKMRRNVTIKNTYLYLPFDETSNILFVIKDGQGMEEVLFQPVPVLGYLL